MPSPTQQRGDRQEHRAERVLLEAGYQIEARNWRGGGGEIDRVAWDGETLVFVEIRSRASGDHGTPAATVGRSKQRRVVRAALAYLGERSGPVPEVRFDVLALLGEGPDPEVELVKGAFDARPLFGKAIPFL
jgi:putative endonuclease